MKRCEDTGKKDQKRSAVRRKRSEDTEKKEEKVQMQKKKDRGYRKEKTIEVEMPERTQGRKNSRRRGLMQTKECR